MTEEPWLFLADPERTWRRVDLGCRLALDLPTRFDRVPAGR